MRYLTSESGIESTGNRKVRDDQTEALSETINPHFFLINRLFLIALFLLLHAFVRELQEGSMLI